MFGGPQGPYQQTGPSYQSSVSYTWTPDRKDPVIAIILALLIPGVGHIYVGRVTKGVLILLFMLLFGSLFWLPAFFLFDLSLGLGGFIWWNTIGTVVLIVVYIWQVVDAYRLAGDHNRGQAPRRY